MKKYLVKILIFLLISGFCLSIYSSPYKLKVKLPRNIRVITSEIVERGNVGVINRIAVDRRNRPHIVYIDARNKRLRYAVKKSVWLWAFRNCLDSSYTYELDEKIDKFFIDTKIDSNNVIHICFNDGGRWSRVQEYRRRHGVKRLIYFSRGWTTKLKYVKLKNGNFGRVKIITDKFINEKTSLTLDKKNNAYICFTMVDRSFTHGEIWLMAYKKEGYTKKQLYISTLRFYRYYLHFDQDDKLHSVIFFAGSSGMYYVTNAYGKRIICPLEGDSSGYIITVAFDKKKKTHIIHADSDKTEYLTNKKGAWEYRKIDIIKKISTIDSATDSRNNLHLCYISNNQLFYANNCKGYWQKYRLDTNCGYKYADACSIAIDKNDSIHISYYNNKHKDLRYLKFRYEK